MNDHPTKTAADTGSAYGFARTGYAQVETRALTTADLESATVYGRDDEVIGAIRALQLDEDGRLTHAVVDVGGFLGMGAHSVLLPFADLTLLRDAAGLDLRIYIDTTKEKLKAMPLHRH